MPGVVFLKVRAGLKFAIAGFAILNRMLVVAILAHLIRRRVRPHDGERVLRGL